MRIIAALFSIVMPGFGQIYNGQFIKGLVFVIFEHFDNSAALINQAIHLDFNGQHADAIRTVNFQYLLFYSPFYAYNVWDAMFFARPGLDKARSAIPFVCAAIVGEIGSIYATLIPFPSFTIGLLVIIPMLIGLLVFARK
ncbi:hypothetical protein [Brevibacillus fulvus]|uniref:DUF5683 domain-containing protein n=1 Tax=Brevibacillus fulvus TaxID=1125967 RepID=A0A938XW08_9BACL|nr:hypothetical protein [Brevibacillus fulvus]MBM7588971.1 hypothetical protein [Brevibacillus fulvus]